MAKRCLECDAPRGTPHALNCSNSGQRQLQTAPLSKGGLVISRTPLSKAEADEGLAVSRSTGRISLHTPMDQAPPGMTMPDDGEIRIIIFDDATEEPISAHKGAFDVPAPGDVLVDGDKKWQVQRVDVVHEHKHFNVFVVDASSMFFEAVGVDEKGEPVVYDYKTETGE